MEVHKFYDAVCSRCGNWYSTSFKVSVEKTKALAIKEMKRSGWGVVQGKTYCHMCH